MYTVGEQFQNPFIPLSIKGNSHLCGNIIGRPRRVAPTIIYSMGLICDLFTILTTFILPWGVKILTYPN